jgi:LPXTG-motif cell wall-anchored protein
MRLAAALVMLLALGTAGSVAAQTTLKDAPPPMVQTTPVVLGEITGVTSHSATVRTTRGETMNFETDSRTVMPMNLMTEKRVKVEFHLMENGNHHAGRITVIEPGSKDWDRYDEELTMVPRIDESMEQHASLEGDRHEHHDASMTNDGNHDNDGEARNELRSNTSDRDESTANRNDDEDKDELPRTASRQPLLLGAGLAALALGLVVAFARRRRIV